MYSNLDIGMRYNSYEYYPTKVLPFCILVNYIFSFD